MLAALWTCDARVRVYARVSERPRAMSTRTTVTAATAATATTRKTFGATSLTNGNGSLDPGIRRAAPARLWAQIRLNEWTFSLSLFAFSLAIVLGKLYVNYGKANASRFSFSLPPSPTPPRSLPPSPLRPCVLIPLLPGPPRRPEPRTTVHHLLPRLDADGEAPLFGASTGLASVEVRPNLKPTHSVLILLKGTFPAN